MSEFRNLAYKSDRLVRGKLLTERIDPRGRDIPAKYRPWLGAAPTRVLDRYKPFQCKGCGRLDELACFRSGLPERFVVPQPRPDLHTTDEYIDLWSRRLADCVMSAAPDAVELFDLPGDPGYVLPWPRRLFGWPERDASHGTLESIIHALRFGSKRACPQCGRYLEVVINPQKFVVPQDVIIAGIRLDWSVHEHFVAHIIWIVGHPLVEHLRSGKFTNCALLDRFGPADPERAQGSIKGTAKPRGGKVKR